MDFLKGMGFASVMWLAAIVLYNVVSEALEEVGVDNRLTIEYYSPRNEYDRELVETIMRDSGIESRFKDKDVKMTKFRIRYVLENPRNLGGAL